MVWATSMGWSSSLSSQTACGPGPCWLDKLAPRGEQLVSMSLFLTTLGSSQEWTLHSPHVEGQPMHQRVQQSLDRPSASLGYIIIWLAYWGINGF